MLALQSGPIDVVTVPAAMQRDESTSQRLLADLQRDGLVQLEGLSVRLPD
jgi:predicted transcriptional regulator